MPFQPFQSPWIINNWVFENPCRYFCFCDFDLDLFLSSHLFRYIYTINNRNFLLYTIHVSAIWNWFLNPDTCSIFKISNMIKRRILLGLGQKWMIWGRQFMWEKHSLMANMHWKVYEFFHLTAAIKSCCMHFSEFYFDFSANIVFWTI